VSPGAARAGNGAARVAQRIAARHFVTKRCPFFKALTLIVSPPHLLENGLVSQIPLEQILSLQQQITSIPVY
jgi:hypothetical protein